MPATDRKSLRLRVHAVPIELEVEAAVTRMDFECDLSIVWYDERWGASAVHRERRANESAGAVRQQRAPARHRIRARPQRGCDHNPVARETDVELPVHAHVDDQLSAPAPSENEIV